MDGSYTLAESVCSVDLRYRHSHEVSLLGPLTVAQIGMITSASKKIQQSHTLFVIPRGIRHVARKKEDLYRNHWAMALNR